MASFYYYITGYIDSLEKRKPPPLKAPLKLARDHFSGLNCWCQSWFPEVVAVAMVVDVCVCVEGDILTCRAD